MRLGLLIGLGSFVCCLAAVHVYMRYPVVALIVASLVTCIAGAWLALVFRELR